VAKLAIGLYSGTYS
jgi:ubiquitin carboxyl-terminal hydrolase 5/13